MRKVKLIKENIIHTKSHYCQVPISEDEGYLNCWRGNHHCSSKCVAFNIDGQYLECMALNSTNINGGKTIALIETDEALNREKQ